MKKGRSRGDGGPARIATSLVANYRRRLAGKSDRGVVVERFEPEVSLDGVEVAAMRVKWGGGSQRETRIFFLAPRGGGTLWQVQYQGTQAALDRCEGAVFDSFARLPF